MLRLRTIVITIIIYLMAYISLCGNINIFKPFYLLKDYLIYPVLAVIDDHDNKLSDEQNKNIIKSLQSDIASLKDLTGIKTVLSDMEVINATVIERNRMYWFNTITIDKGESDGLVDSLAVINDLGLIGRLTKVNKYTSEIKLLTTNDINSKTSVVITSNNQKIYGIMNGYDYNLNLLTVTLTTKNMNILEGSMVETTGMGGIMPSGILIGKVESIKLDKYEVGSKVYVKPMCDFTNLKYVSILKRK